MRKLLMIGAATAMLAGTSFGVMAQQPPCATYPDCPTAGTGWGGPWHGRHYGGWRGGGGPGPCYGYGAQQGGMMGGYMLYGLNLTDEQVAKINEIRQQQRLETHNKVREVLTPEQRAIFDQRFNANQPILP
jgi:P pilus assembly/Cpx signaling pathway, periplasmic inhibitor/zinc-resistance associated protein